MTIETHPSLRARRLQTLQAQISRLDIRLRQLYQRSARYTQVRLGVFVLGALLSAAAFWFVGGWLFGSLTVLVWLIAFGIAVYVHQQLEHGILRFEIWRQLKLNQVARMTLDWEALPSATIGRAVAAHPFARDLDLTGERSMHRLLDTSASVEGGQRLRDWLFEPTPNIAHIQQRQDRVKALVPYALFRQKLSLNGLLAETGSGGWRSGEKLLQWLAEENDTKPLRIILLLSAILVPINIVLFVLYLLGQVPALWVAVPFVIYAFLALLKFQETAALFNNALILQNGLKKLEGVFNLLETFPLERESALHALAQPFREAVQRPSTRLKQVSRVVTGAGLTQNPFLALLLNILVPWNLYFAYRLTLVRRDIAGQLPQWLDIWFELEALSSLAEFAWLNPDYAFPELINLPLSDMETPFKAQALGHPLLPRDEKISNDFNITALGEVNLITGSNMAGKSSFLRTIGVNLRLAYIGGPVDAAACRTIPFRMFSCLNVSDSVTDGISYFYAEVKRLKALLAALESGDDQPLFYLIDEIFRGTNNRERYIGSRSYIRALVSQNGFGLVATHDLDLVKLEDELPQIKNFHFRETVENGRMVFDYQLHSGPCPTTNALEIMRVEGLPVEETT